MPSLRVTVAMRDELARRKALISRLWAGQPVEHIPIDVRVVPPPPHPVRERVLDSDKQLEAGLAAAAATWTLAPSSDAIPALFPDVGCSCLASAFGAEYYWGESVEQTPGVLRPVITDLEQQVEGLPVPNPRQDGWIPEGLRRIRMFAEAGDGFLPVTLLDAAGGLNVAADLMGMSELLLAFYTAPEAVHRLLDKIQTLFLATIQAGIEAAGGERNIANTDFLEVWFPEGRKGHVSDDICSSFGPATYMEFSAPYHARVFAEFGRGGLHNCGPHPCHSAYVAAPWSPRALDIEDQYSHRDLPALAHSLRGKALVYLGWDQMAGDPVRWFGDVMELMAPRVAVVPIIKLAPGDEPETVCRRLLPIAREYAQRMDWGFAD
jgi:hypothetical protein